MGDCETDYAQPHAVRATKRQRARRSAARTISRLAFLAGTVNLVSAAFPAERARLSQLDEVLPGSVMSAALIVSVGAGVGLLLLAGGLRRRKRIAWVWTVLLLLGSCFSHYLKGLDIEEAMIEAFIAGYLLDKGHEFNARSNAREHLSVIWPGILVLVATFAYGMVGLSVRENIGEGYGLWDRFLDISKMAIGMGLSSDLEHRFGPHFATSVAVLFYIGAAFVLVRVLRPVFRHDESKRVSCEEARASGDSLAWFATRDDREAVRAPNGAIAYGAFGSVALATGDPFGDRAAWPETVKTFLDQVRSYGQVPAVIGCGREAAAVYRDAGMIVMYMGDEAVLDLQEFSPDRKGMKIARQSWNRAKRAGFTASVHFAHELSDAEVASLRELSNHWRGDAAERGYSMALGRLFDARDSESVFAIARDPGGVPAAFLHFVPWGSDGLSLDVMRRERDAPGFLNDFLVMECAVQLRSIGMQRISLNFSFLRAIVAGELMQNRTTEEISDTADLTAPISHGTMAEKSDKISVGRLRMSFPDPSMITNRLEATRRLVTSPILVFTRWVLRRLSQRFQIESLYRFNKKFAPTWRPRYFALEAPEDAPRVLITALRAEGLIALPRLRRDSARSETARVADGQE